MNLKRMITGAAVLIASLSLPQALIGQQYPTESSWSITGADEGSVEITLRFRNTQGYDPNKIFGITSIGFSYLGPTNVNCSTMYCLWSSPILSTIGNVDKSPFFLGGYPLNFSLGDLALLYAPNHESMSFGPLYELRRPGANTWGVMGCQTVPDVPTLWGSSTFAGRTCASEGFDGWIEAKSSFWTGGIGGTGIDGRTLTAADFSAGPGGEYRILPTPEPGTYALLAFGLGAVAMFHRKRRSE